jgi:hypothetical protein
MVVWRARKSGEERERSVAWGERRERCALRVGDLNTGV